MKTLSPGSRPARIQLQCEFCGSHGMTVNVFTDGPDAAFRTRRNVQYERPVLMGYKCDGCGVVCDTKTLLQKAPKPDVPVRPERVTAIKRLKAAGYRFFEWEPVS